ncbi:MAG TPA: alpha/beta fold hydrolase [Candidatus Limnocylindria bacterium]|nr:alpha/beta fold hydrolase [Candidatus Limnocylindria bacterium]
MSRAAVLAPGYGGTATQPVLRALAQALAAHGIESLPITFRTRGRRPSAGYATELDDLRAARDALRATHEKVALVGRSFGGRMCAFLAEIEPPDALAIVGHPIAPPSLRAQGPLPLRPRPRDEAALAAIRCRTLVVQGDADELGPVAVLERIAGQNPLIDLVVVAGAGHELGTHEREAVEHVARWLDAALR